jgi:tRNA1(Val) A37 N6-methylase TrmN6
MKDLFSLDKLNTLGVYIGLITGFATIAVWIFRNIVSLINYSKIKNVKSGIYNGFWVDPLKNEINCEILRLKKTIRGLKIIPIYKHKAFHNYIVYAKPYSLNQYVFGGQWFGQKNTIYKGYSLFLYNIEDENFTGKWIGPKSTGEINSGDWIMIYSSEAKNSYLAYRKFKKLYNLREKIFPSATILDNITKKHEEYNNRTCSINNIVLNLNKDSFIPTLGKISIPLARYVETIIKQSDVVLDLGTGTGFYPIYLSKNTGCKAKGIDSDEKAITLARSNAYQNGVSPLTEFATCLQTELFSSIKLGEKFDYIIANLPFTRISKSYKSRKSIHYNSFSGSIDLLEQLILGSQYHIKPNGKLIFCYGESGYRDLLESIVKISSWDYLKIVSSFNENDETFYIFELELSKKVQNYYSKLNNEQKALDEKSK